MSLKSRGIKIGAKFGFLGALLGMVIAPLGIVSTIDSANAASPTNPYVTSTLEKLYDGTGFVDGRPSPASSFINGENGFYPGDNGPDDGYVTTSDYVGYHWETKVAAGPARKVEVKLEIPEYLTFNKSLNETFCVNLAGIKASYNNNASAPGCIYDVKAGQSFSAGVDLTLVAKDTKGLIQENQILKTSNSIQGEAAYSSDSAEPVTVLSAPTADLLIRPAQCSVTGSCSSMSSSSTSSSFIIFPETIKWQGYNSLKGATAGTPWTAQVDVSGMPEGTTYSIGGVVYVPDANGLIQLPESTGSVTLNYTAPANWGGEEFQEGETRDFPVHLIVPDTAFATEGYKNNGDGWEPGQDEGSAFSTLNDRDSGSRKGYYYPNNDWTKVQVYKPRTPIIPPGQMQSPSKDIERPWKTNETLWEPGNVTFDGGGSPKNVADYSRPAGLYRKVTEGTQTWNLVSVYPSSNPDVVAPGQVVLMDTWNPVEQQIDGKPLVLDNNGNELTGFTYKVQWSPSIITDVGLNADSNTGWFDTNPATADPTKVKSVRVVLEGIPLGAGAPDKITLKVPLKVADPYAVENPGAFSDTSFVKINGKEYSVSNYVVPVTKPTPSVGLTGKASDAKLDREKGSIDYTYSPTVSGLTSTTDPITGEVTFTVDACLTGIDLTGSGWVMVGDFTPGTGCMTDDPQSGSFTVKPAGDDWIPGNNYNASTGTTTLPDIKFTGTVNPMTVGDINVTGVWTLTDPEGAQPSNPVSVTTAADDYELTSPALATSTPKVEIEDTLKFTASITAKNMGETSLKAEAILVLPGRGYDASYLDALKAMNPDDPYGQNDEPTESDFSGSYLMTKLALNTETSVPGSQLLCTTKGNPSVNPVDYEASDWSTDCTDDAANPITAVKITQPDGLKPAGVNLDIELQPTGNEAGDNYLMWLGPIYVDGDAKSMVWPVNNEVVASTISGYTYWDASGKGMARTDDSKPVTGMKVSLLDSSGVKIAETNVDENGYYEFTNLHSGTYFTQVPDIGQPGGAPAQLESHFDANRRIDVEQTFSYANKKGDQSSSKSTAIALGIDTVLKNVNFGYYAPDPYSDLLKKPAQVRCDGDAVICDVTWEIVVKNGGESFDPSEILGATGASPAGGDGSGVWTSDGYWIVKSDGTTIKAQNLSGTVLGATGASPASDSSGSGVWTTDGYWIVKNDGTTTKAQNLSGTVLGATGASPASDSSGSGVWTTDGYYIVKSDDTTIKAQNLSGTVLGATGASPAGGNGSGVWTSDGYYIVKSDGTTTKAQNLSGTVLGATGDAPAISYSFSGVWTTDGYWIVKFDGTTTKAQNLSGTVLGATAGFTPGAGSGVWTTDGYWFVEYDGIATKAQNLSGTVLGATGDYYPANDSGVWTTDGYYIVKSDDTTIKADIKLPKPPENAAAPITLTGGKLTDSTSSAVYDIEVMTGEKVLGATGVLPASNSGSGVWTTDGYYIVNSSGAATRVTGLSGAVLGATGSYPASSGGSGVWTTDGYYIVNSSGVATKVTDITGSVLGAIGEQPMGNSGSGVWTSDGYYIVNSSGVATKVTDITGSVLGAIGSPMSSNGGSGVWTSDGYYIVNSSGVATKVTDITGSVLGAIGSPMNSIGGSGVWTTDGYYIVNSSGVVTKADITGSVLGATGSSPARNKYGSGVWTTDGYYIVNSDGASIKANIAGSVLGATGGSPAQLGYGSSGAWTDDGYYTVSANGAAIKANITGSVLGATGNNPMYSNHGGGVWTTEGYYITVGRSATKVNINLDKVVYNPLSETINGDFTTREYKISNLAPGEEVTYYFSGKVNRNSYESNDGNGIVIGNQAWETFNETPRNAPELPKPALPAYDKASGQEFKYGQWTGNSSCTATDNWVVPGDQCGQVYAQVPPTDQLLGSLAGYVFWDQDRDGVQVPADPMVVSTKVTLYKGANGAFDNKVGETLTDGDGYYLFENLVPGADYYVAYSPIQNPKVSTDGGATTSDMLDPGQSWIYTVQYKDSPFYAVNRSASNADGYTENVEVVANNTTEPVNAGLVVYEADIVVTKGTMVDGALQGSIVAELDENNPGFTKPIPVTSVSTNTGQESLNNLVFTDQNLNGPKVVWDECVINDPASTTDISSGVWDEDVFTFTFPTATTLSVGGTLTCTGTLPAVSTEEFPNDDLLHRDEVKVAGTGAITGTPVADDAPFEVVKSELPEPMITLEKGIATPIVEGTDCSDSSNAKNPNLCSIESGTEAEPIEVVINETNSITFRITNTGPEALLDLTLDDQTTIGDFDVEDISCSWPTKSVNGQTRNYLGTLSPNNVGICVGTLKITEIDSLHQDKAEVFAVGEVSKKLVTDDAEFNAKTPVYDPPGIDLPLTGGQTAALFIILGIVAAGVTVTIVRVSAKKHRRFE